MSSGYGSADLDSLKPTRGANRYRNYSDEDVALLRFLKEQLDAGNSIGELAKLGREELLGRAPAERRREGAPSFDNTVRHVAPAGATVHPESL